MDERTTREPLFRPSKRRKIFRKRQGDENEEDGAQPTSPRVADDDSVARSASPSDSLDISEVIKVRRHNKSRGVGVAFSSTSSRPTTTTSVAETDTRTHDDAPRLQGIEDRFITHTGQVVDVDKHMVAYIESEMAKRRSQSTTDNGSQPTATTNPLFPSTNVATTATQQQSSSLSRNPAALGKIQEIDLGPTPTLLNRQRTEALLRRAAGEDVGPLPPTDVAPKKKKERVRLGRNGKPIVRRGPKPRNTEDVERDRLVEALMREGRGDMYDNTEETEEAQGAGNAGDGDDDGEADERLAERFRQDFMEAMQARSQQNKPKASMGAQGKTGPGAGDKDNPLKGGPKLGGSRSARAAMHRAMEGGKK